MTSAITTSAITTSAIVTGGGSGIGEVIARRLVATGMRVGVLDVNEAGARSVAQSLGDTGDPGDPGARAVALIASTVDEAAVQRCLDEFGTPDLLVNNAGIVRFGPLADLSAADWRAVVEVNLTGTYLTARAVACRLRAEGRRGAIVNITSMNGVMPGPNAGAYGSTKAAIALLTQQMAIEWAPWGLRVNAVAPGLIDGGMSAPIYADSGFREIRSSKVPLGRLGTADDIADAVLFLASDAASYITGQNLLVDGGVTMNMISQLPRPQSVDSVGSGNPGADGGDGGDGGAR